MRREILVPALGWIASGIVSIAAWSLQSGRTVCNCPSIPVNASPSAIHALCSCPTPMGLLYIGVLVIMVGIGLLASSNRISKMMDAYKTKRPSK